MEAQVNTLLFAAKSKNNFVEWAGCFLIGLSLTFFLATVNTIFLGVNIVEPYFLFGWDNIVSPGLYKAIDSGGNGSQLR